MQLNLDKPIRSLFEKITLRHVLIALILILTIITRLYNLDARVMSHDEVNHVVPSFDLFSGRGYKHDPITHGPLQFHLIALSYFLFGDNDFTSRLPHALFSIATVAFVLTYYKRYLGKYGSLAAGFFFAISPFMMFYGRYARNEAFCALFSVMTLYYVLRYLEEREGKYLVGTVITLALNFAAKETAYIFTAELLIFLLVLVIKDISKIQWPETRMRRETLFAHLAAIGAVVLALGASVFLVKNAAAAVANGTISQPSLIDVSNGSIFNTFILLYPVIEALLPSFVILFASAVILLVMREKLNWPFLAASSKSFNLLIITGALVLPLLAPFPVAFTGISSIAYTEALPILTDYLFIIYFISLSIIIGFIWRPKDWWKFSLIFFGIYITLYTTFFTNPSGIVTGMIGSLGHWLSQQTVQRGGQPLYYFALIQIPIYEFLAAGGTMAAFIIGLRRKSFWSYYPKTVAGQETSSQLPIPAIFIYWSIISLIAYSFAGEKMPWLTVHIIFAMLLCAGWVVQKLIESRFKIAEAFGKNNRIFVLTAIFVFLLILLAVQVLGAHAPFQSKTQEHLQDTNHFFFMAAITAIAGYFLFKGEKPINRRRLLINVCSVLFILMSVITFRSAYRASFINYDYPYEFLVYAHASNAPKIALNQIEEISKRLTGRLDVKVAYDNNGLYPYWWYLRNYPNKIVYLENPTRSLEDADLIIAGADKYDEIDAITRDNFYSYNYMRLWWPMQDYFNLNWQRIASALSTPEKRQALFDIWLNRDYTRYAQANTNNFLTLDNWLPSEQMRLYVRKDIAAKMWQLNTGASLQQVVEVDPYEEKTVSKQPDYFIGMSGSNPGELSAPHGIDIAPDGNIYVADSGNHRIEKFSPQGVLIATYGTYANILEAEAPGGTMNQPWDVAVADDGSFFVADTFNHRIQKLSADGRFVKMWGVFAQGKDAQSMWGPRGIVIDRQGNLLVTDTGNKRVMVFDRNLNFITQFGGAGFEAGEFDEPVGIAVSEDGKIVVADTWNRRVQIFEADESGLNYTQVGAFDVDAWYGSGIDNKPYISVSPQNHILISDPGASRILVFSMEGEFLAGWEGLALSSETISQPYGMDFDSEGNLWISDAASNMVLRFPFDVE